MNNIPLTVEITAEQILQKARDLHAEKRRYADWEDLKCTLVKDQGYRTLQDESELASILAVRAAFEAGYRQGFIDRNNHKNHKYSEVHKHDCNACGKTGVSFCSVFRCEVMDKLANPE